MNRLLQGCLAVTLSLLAAFYCQPTSAQTAGKFEAGKGCFLLNDKPFVVKAAELHYPRIPRPYWEHRIRLCKALGMNTICLYVFWNYHEAELGKFDFSGQRDLAEFCRLCQKHGLYVILRPGPYVCAEWEMGGLPWWLLKKEDIRLREPDSYFMERVAIFEHEVAKQVAPLTIANGGPIIMVQVENEYGAYDINKDYVAQIRDIVRKEFGNEVTLFQCDWSSTFQNNGLDDLIWTLNFGTGSNIEQQFAPLRKMRPDTPLMCSEFWSGWFDKWGTNHEIRPAETMVQGIDDMLSQGISFSLYMTHGGTNWGHWAGANCPSYAPDVTSYDYDAPISESGRTTPKYDALRKLLSGYMYGEKLPKVPAPIPTVSVPAFNFTEVAPLFDNLPTPRRDSEIHSMEAYDQGFGTIIYRTTLPAIETQSVLTIDEVHDYARIYLDHQLVGTLDRRFAEKQLTLPPCKEEAQLDIVVEAMGRVNFGWAMKDYKGITQSVQLSVPLGNRTFTCNLKDWEVFNLHDAYEKYKQMNFRPLVTADTLDGKRLPGCYRATFNLKKTGDTFLRFDTWGKGLVYVNGYPMGRIWEIGPQQTLYMPGCWLKKGENEILVFDIIGPQQPVSEGLKQPILDQLKAVSPLTHRKDGQTLNLSGIAPVFEGSFAHGNGWQHVNFNQVVSARYLCLEALDAHDGKDLASIAELYLTDAQGKRISRENWQVKYADSEEVSGLNCAADKVFDLQESTSWTTAKGTAFPHAVVIDLGAIYQLKGLDYLPRMEKDVPGAIRNFRVYVSQSDFSYSE